MGRCRKGCNAIIDGSVFIAQVTLLAMRQGDGDRNRQAFTL